MNLLYLCIIDSEQTYNVTYNYSPLRLDNIHYKYNFIIAPYYTSYYFNIKGNGSDIKLSYPGILDFSKDANIIIRLIMPSPSSFKKIKLISDSLDLECLDLKEMKLCNISFTYFKKQFSGNFNFYHENDNHINIYYGCHPIYANLSKIIDLSIKNIYNISTQYMGNDYILYFSTNYIDSANIFNNLESNELSFPLKFSNNKNDKNIDGNCNLWEPDNDFMRLICKLNDKFENEEQIIYLNDNWFNFNDYKIFFYTFDEYLIVRQLNSKISFLYSDKQELNINNYIDSYTLKFKKIFYYNEKLILYKYRNKRAQLNCVNGRDEVICNIKRDDITPILSYNGEQFFISQMVNDVGILPINSILNITIYYPNIYKIQLYVETLKLLTPVVEKFGLIVYETIIIRDQRITTNFFDVQRNIKNIFEIINCQLKTSNINSHGKILFLCMVVTSGQSSLGNLSGLNLLESSILYNFKIFGIQNLESYTVTNSEGTIIYAVYPEELNFNEQDTFIIRYETEYPERLKGIKLNIDSSFDLECNNKIGIKECFVNRSHFDTDGDYYTYHLNSYGSRIISYEINTIKVILKDDSDGEEESGDEGEDEKEDEKKEEKEEEKKDEKDDEKDD